MVNSVAELCRNCFIEIWRPYKEDIENIVMSTDFDMCEGCMNWGQYVSHIEEVKNIAKEESNEV